MNDKKRLSVNDRKLRGEFKWGYPLIMGVFAIIQIINYRDKAAQTAIILMVQIPCIIALIYMNNRFEVVLEDGIITVSTWSGRKYSFRTDDIDMVKLRLTKTNGLPGEVMKIRTGRHSFRVNRYMKDYFEFKDYIRENVDPERITVIEKDYRSKRNRKEN